MEWREVKMPWAGTLPDLEAIRRQLCLPQSEFDLEFGVQSSDDRSLTIRLRAETAATVERVLEERLPLPAPA